MERGRLARCGRGRPRSIHPGLFFNWLFGLNRKTRGRADACFKQTSPENLIGLSGLPV